MLPKIEWFAFVIAQNDHTCLCCGEHLPAGTKVLGGTVDYERPGIQAGRFVAACADHAAPDEVKDYS